MGRPGGSSDIEVLRSRWSESRCHFQPLRFAAQAWALRTRGEAESYVLNQAQRAGVADAGEEFDRLVNAPSQHVAVIVSRSAPPGLGIEPCPPQTSRPFKSAKDISIFLMHGPRSFAAAALVLNDNGSRSSAQRASAGPKICDRVQKPT